MEHSAKFCRLETIRDFKKFYYCHSNIYKSYDDFENLKGMAYRLVCPAQLKYEIRMAITW